MQGLVLLLGLVVLVAASDDDELHAVVAGLAAVKGTWVAHFRVAAVPGAGRGVVASQDMPEGSLVLHLPVEWHLDWRSVEGFLSSSTSRALRRVDAQQLVAVYVALERFRLLPREPSWWQWLTGPVSWAPIARWVDQLPASPASFVDWPPALLRDAAQLLGQPLSPLWDVALLWEAVAAAGTGLSESQWRWGYAVLASRSFHSPNGATLLPVADLFNHAPASDATVRFQAGQHWAQGHSFTTARFVRAGEQLTLSYGNRTNWDLLTTYGFVLVNNPHDEYQLPSTGSGVGLVLTWSGVRPASVVRWMDSARPGSWELSRALADQRGAAWGTAVAQLCREQLARPLWPRTKRLEPLLRERERMLRKCAREH